MEENPKNEAQQKYLLARREWMERYGDYIAQAKNWRMAALASIGIAAIFGVGMVYEADRVHVVPYVVEVNHLGQSVHLAQEVQAGTYSMPVVRHVIANWVRTVRERLPEIAEEKQVYDSAYDIVSSREVQLLDGYFTKHNPYSNFTKNEGGRTVKIISVLPLGQPNSKGGQLQVQWQEKQYGSNGEVEWKKRYQGVVSYQLVPPSSNPRILQKDPYGIVITSFVSNQISGGN